MMKKKPSLSSKIFLNLSLLLIVCQLITVFWIWHETSEQIDAIFKLPLGSLEQKKAMNHEKFEILMILLGSMITMLFLTLFLSYRCIRWIVKPFEEMAKEIEKKSASDLTPIRLKHHVKEIMTIQEGINQLLLRLKTTLDEERLFTADVAHELRTPLSGIRLHLELFQKAHHIDCSHLIARIDRLVKSVSQLLILSRATQNKSVGILQSIQPYYDLFLPLKQEFSELAALKNQTIQWKITEKESVFYADESLICLLIRNLVENACKYSDSNTQITIEIRFVFDEVLINIIDQGIGIDESKINSLTNAFFQMDNKNHGVGLGLSIVNRIAHLYQAEFIIKNNAIGTTASFRLKIVKTTNKQHETHLAMNDEL